MTSLSKAKLTLALVCILFFVLGSGSMFALAPLVKLSWSRAPSVQADPDFARLLKLTPDQIKKEQRIYREWDARLKIIDDEIKRTFYPRIQGTNKKFSERLNGILTPEQRLLLEEYSTGKRKLPADG